VYDVQDWRITTWNLQGSHGLDRRFVVEHIRRERPDVFVVQEIMRRQARSLAEDLAMEHVWARKHTPVPGRSEGMAILTPHAIGSWDSAVLTAAPQWSWRRRILLRAQIIRGTDRVGVLNVHLSPHDAGELREREFARIEAELGGGPDRPGIDLIVGDFNDDPSVAAASFDPSLGAHDIGADASATCWSPGDRTGRLPGYRVDGAIGLGRFVGVRASTPSTDLDRWAKVSDHLPVTVEARRDVPAGSS
jgi:endonuclease/exonuclease/phosphatase family metal-dependent hydrolase